MGWFVSRREFDGLKEGVGGLKTRISQLDPENVSKRLQEAIEEIKNFQNTTRKELEKKVEAFTTSVRPELNATIEKTVGERIAALSRAQDTKIEEFISSSRKTVKMIWSQISEVIKNTLEPVLAGKPAKPGNPEK